MEKTEKICVNCNHKIVDGEHKEISHSSMNKDGSIDYSVCGVVVKEEDYGSVVCGCENPQTRFYLKF